MRLPAAFAALALVVAAPIPSGADAKPPSAAPKIPGSIPALSPTPLPFSGPCKEKVQALKAGDSDPAPYLAAAACFRADSSAPAPGTLAGREELRRRLPPKESWYVTYMERFRARRDIANAVNMAWLAELKALPSPNLYREMGEVYQLASDPYRAGLALLWQADLDTNQAGYLQYQLETAIRGAASDVPAPALLDSLAAGHPPARARTADMFENLCWNFKHYPGAYRMLMLRVGMQKHQPTVLLDRAERFQQMGYWDYAAGILDRLAWKKLPQPWQAQGRALDLRVRYQLQEWAAIAAETSKPPARGSDFPEEEEYIAAAALLNLGKSQAARDRLRVFAGREETPWGYRAGLLLARAQLAQGKTGEAEKTLADLKKSPRRRESSGPVLFWQGCLAAQQGRFAAAESVLVLASAYTGDAESQRALDFRFWLLLDTAAAARIAFFRGLEESPLAPEGRMKALDQVPPVSGLWPYARLEKAQILVGLKKPDSAWAVLDETARQAPDCLARLQAEAKAAYLQEKRPGGRASALARYEDLLIKYQQGVVPEFSRGRIKAAAGMEAQTR